MATVQSVVRSMTLLEKVAHRPRGLVDLADAAQLPTTTTARLLATLEDVHALRRDDEGIYRIGPTIISLVSAGDVKASLRAVAHPYMVELVGVVDEAVGLSIPVDGTAVTIAQVDAPRAVKAEDWYGTRWTLLGGGTGYALMATWSQSEVDELLDGIAAPDRLRVRDGIAATRAASVSWSHGDYVDELSSVAAAIVDDSGRGIAALYVYGPSYRFPDGATDDTERRLVEMARRISEAWNARTGRTVVQ
jgi:IclR family acetate operon transcriptional repressor